jgi:HAD superfamily hydrolase (TIGR01509 family)
MIKTVMIDLDGTLIDSIDGLYQSYLDFLKAYEVHGTRAEFDSLNGPTIREAISIFKSKYNLMGDDGDLYNEYMNLVALHYKNAKPFPYTTEFLAFLRERNMQVILVTSSPKDKAMGVITQNQWDQYFDHFVFGDEVQHSKPHPEIYQKALEKAVGEIKNSIAIEDSPNGIRAAVSAGIENVFGMGFNQNSEALKYAGAKHVFDDFLNLKDFIEKGME